MEDTYRRFLGRAAAALASSGAAPILPAPQQDGLSARGDWQQILLLDNPGSPVFYAFTQIRQEDVEDLRRRIDQLAQNLLSQGLLSRGPIAIVFVAVAPDGLQRGTVRRLSRLAPSEYLPGLRPSVVVVDLDTRHVYSSGLFRRPPGIDLLEQATRSTSPTEDFDLEQLSAIRQLHADRLAAFRRLMQGRQPIVTYGLVAINVLIFALMYANGTINGNTASDTGLRAAGALSPKLIEQGQWWRLFTTMFLHAGVTHILLNMVSLLAIGTLAERFYGNAKFLAIYLGSGLIGSLVSFGHSVAIGQTDILGVGASGAIFGVAGALVTVRFQRSDVIPRTVRQQLSSWMISLVLLNLVMSHFIANVDNYAHVGGLIGGIALSFALPLPRRVSEVH